MNLNIKLSWRIVALWYLALPVILFFMFWLRAPYNIIFSGITMGVGLKYSLDSSKSHIEKKINYRYIALTFCICLLFTVFSGAGGFVWQKPDWTKHNVVLNDLINYRWPVNYGAGAYVSETSLVYYVAYYLPAALFGKLLGWRAGEIGLFIQSFVGLYIFAQLIGEEIRFSWKKFALFFFLSGMDIVGVILLQGLDRIIHPPYYYLEQYASGLQFSSIMTQLMWVPQHALAGWIVVMLAYKDYREDRLAETLVWYVAITLLWSPFVGLGLALLFGPLIISRKKNWIINAYLLPGIAISSIILLYYRSNIYVVGQGIKIYVLSNIHFINNVGTMLAFLILDLYVFAIVLFIVKHWIHTRDKKLVIWIFVLLIMISQVMYGLANDFVMRVSIPALTLLFIFVLQHIEKTVETRSWMTVVVVLIFLFCACTPVLELIRDFHRNVEGTNERPIYSMINAHVRYKVVHQQYMGLATKAFGKYFGNYLLHLKDEN